MCTPKQPKLCRQDDCDVCGPRRVPKDIIEKYWIFEKNPGIDPYVDVTRGSNKEAWFICKECGHHTYVRIHKFVGRNRGCTFCSKKGEFLCKDPNCHVCNERRDPIMLKNWIYDRNPGVNPLTIPKSSSKRFWMICRICDHPTYVQINNYTGQNEGCEYCGIGEFLCGDPNCHTCNERRDPDMLKYWMFEKNPGINPLTIPKSSNKQFWMRCWICGHPTYVHMSDYTGQNKGCEFCNRYGLCDNPECQDCPSKRFSNHPMSVYLNEEATGFSVRDVKLNSHKTGMFDCPFCDKEYEALIDNVSKNHWCPCRKNKTEHMVLDWAAKMYPEYDVISQLQLPGLPRKKFDVTIKDLKVIIEIDGRQHFRDMKCWDSESIVVQDNDVNKMRHAIQEGYSVIRILQEDIWDNRFDWREVLYVVVKLCTSSLCFFIHRNGEYDMSHIPAIRALNIPIDIIDSTEI